MYSLPIFFLSLFSLSALLLAGEEKEFLDKYHSPTTEEKAVYYRLCKRDNMKRMQGKVKIYRIEGALHSELAYLDGLRDGYCTSYHPNSNLASKGLYDADRRMGNWEYWYDNHQKQKEEVYTEDGKLKIESYWNKNGKQLLKQGTGFYEFFDDFEMATEKGKFNRYEKEGTWVGYFDDGKMYFQEEWMAGKLISGLSHDKSDNTYAYTQAQYHTIPTFEGGIGEITKFLNKTIRYPREAQKAGVEGKISVKFIVDIDGSVKDAQVINSNSYLNEEALRIINMMPAWKPALLRGQKVAGASVLPITFKLR